MIKFFLRSQLKDTHISLEQIAGYLSLWGIIAYLIGWSITYAFSKKQIALYVGYITIVCLLIGTIIGYHPFWIFALLTSSIGICYSLRLITKSIILSIEIQQKPYGETKTNGIVNIAILIGIIVGSFLGFAVFNARWNNGIYSIIGILLWANILMTYTNYDTHFQKKNIITTIKTTIPNIMGITKKYIRLLLPIGTLRAVSTAMGQKMLEIWIYYFQKTTTNTVTIILLSFVGAIIWHIISMFFKKHRKLIATLFTIFLWFATIYFPHIINKFEYFITLQIFWLCIGIFFGIAVNLLEGRYFFHIGEDHRKEYWSAAYGIIISSMIFIIMILSDYLTNTIGSTISFFFFGFLLILMPFFIKKFDT